MSKSTKKPLAIVGMGCRFPGGVVSPESFWRMMSNRTDTICEVPGDRWDARKFFDQKDKKPGKTRVKQGGYLQQSIREFDPLFFGMSPREAAFLDPQQRLLLEVVWEAFEDAGLPEEKFRGSNTGVFVGAFNLDNLLLQLGRDNLELISSSTAAGVTMTMLSNRLSYTFDLQGPSITMDTACSSSMVSTHYACQSVWSGECDMALAGGVNVILRPEYMVSMSKGGFLSPHGRCKAFDEDAKGYVRGEGAGVIVIKPLEKALADNDSIYALIRNSGVNQDGYTQNGISFPSSVSQRKLIDKVYSESQTNPLDVSYVEAHGTGTQAGDPIEISSIASVLAEGRSKDTPCYVGSVKTNIGHTESAAGIAGIIKAALSVGKGEILPNLHFNTPNPKIDFCDGRIAIPTEQTPWDAHGKPRIASVNSFGYGGTNGHIILQEHDAAAIESVSSESAGEWPLPQKLVPVSARTPAALRETCGNLLSFLDSTAEQSIELGDLLYSLAYRRSALDERLCLIVNDMDDLKHQLAAYAGGEIPVGAVQQSIDDKDARQMVFVFTGMGPQWWGMGQELYKSSAVFRAKVDECDHIFKEISGWSIREELLAAEAESNMRKTQVAQPANFVLQASLLALYKSWGVTPAAVVGHSVGEVASAYASGALTLADALQVSFHRSRLQQSLAGQGAMLAIGVGGETAREIVDLYDKVSIAAINSGSSVTLAGSEEQLQEIAELLDTQGVFNRLLQVEVAYHSYQMNPIEEELKGALSDIVPQPETVPLYSTAKGRRLQGTELDADYWWQNVRQPVRFETAIKHLITDGYSHFMEVGPHPVTRAFLSECLEDENVRGRIFSSLVRKEPEVVTFLQSLGQVFAAGYELDWPQIVKQGHFVRLPSYPWQREVYWNESALSQQYLLGTESNNPILYERLMTPEPVWQVEINDNFFPFIDDHRISGRVVFPGAGYIEAGLALQQHYQRQLEGGYSLANLKFHRMLMLDENRAQQLRLVEDRERGDFRIYSSDVNSDNWALHASGHLIRAALKQSPNAIDLDDIRTRCDRTLDTETLYNALDSRGLSYGQWFQTISEIHVGKTSVLARLKSPQFKQDPAANSYSLYSPLLDGAFQSLIALTNDAGQAPMVPVELGEITVYKPGQSGFWCHGEITFSDDNSLKCDLQLVDDEGNVIAELSDLLCTQLAPAEDQDAESHIENSFFEYEWLLVEREVGGLAEASADGANWIILADSNHPGANEALKVIQQACSDRGIHPSVINVAPPIGQVPDEDTAYLEQLEENVKEVLKPGDNRLLYLACGSGSSLLGNLEFDAVANACVPLIALARCADQSERLEKSGNTSDTNFFMQLTVATTGCQAIVEADPVDCTTVAASSVVHALGNELSSIKPKHIDLPVQPSSSDWLAMLDEVLTGDDSEDIALREGQRYVKRLKRANLTSGETTTVSVIVPNDPAHNLQLTLGADAAQTQLSLADIPQPVSMALHLRVEEFLLGNEASGDAGFAGLTDSGLCVALASVLVAGNDTAGFSAGDRVVALVDEKHLASQIAINPAMCTKLPADVPEDLALDLPAFASALHLLDKARAVEGDLIFIQDGASQKGLALIQLALLHKLQVWTAASSASARQYLATLGVREVLDNSDLTYVSEIKSLIGLHKFQVIVNHLADDHFQQCFRLLAPGGKLIQAASSAGGTLQFPAESHHDYTYEFVDHARTLRSKGIAPAVADRLFELMVDRDLTALPKLFCPAASLEDVLSDQSVPSETGQFGFPVVVFDAKPIKIEQTETVAAIDREGTYLVTGGTSGLGLEIARWLLGHGVASIALVSRNGSSREEARAFAQQAIENGKDVQIFDIDIADSQQVKMLVDSKLQVMRPLRGIIHCAMVLDDDLASKVTSDRLRNVMSPKVQGALNFHNATRNHNLSQFISISSISSIIGNVGQFSYVAANAFLDGFAHARRHLGLPGTTINLGVLEDVGVVARDAVLADVLQAKGINGISTAAVMQGLGYIFNNDPTQIGFFDVDWHNWAHESPKSATSSRFRDLVQQARVSQDTPPELVKLLKLLEDQEHYHARLMEIISAELAQIVKLPVSEIRTDRSISDLGIDSLMSVELSRSLRAKYGLHVTSMDLLSGPSLDQITGDLVVQLTEKA